MDLFLFYQRPLVLCGTSCPNVFSDLKFVLVK